MITAIQVAAIWAAPRNERYGSIQDRLGISGLQLFCAQYLVRGMSMHGAAGRINELTARFSKAGDCLRFARQRYPRNCRSGERRSILVPLEFTP